MGRVKCFASVLSLCYTVLHRSIFCEVLKQLQNVGTTHALFLYLGMAAFVKHKQHYLYVLLCTAELRTHTSSGAAARQRLPHESASKYLQIFYFGRVANEECVSYYYFRCNSGDFPLSLRYYHSFSCSQVAEVNLRFKSNCERKIISQD